MHRKLIRIIIQTPWLLFVSIITAEISVILLLLQLKIIAEFIDGIIFRNRGFQDLPKFVIPVVVIILIRSILNFSTEFASKNLAIRIKSKVRKMLADKLIKLASLRDFQSGALLSLFIDDVEALDAYFSQYIPQIILSCLIPVTMLIVIFPIDQLSGWISLITAPLIPFFMILIGKYAQKETDKQFSALHRMSAFFLDSIQGIKTLILLNQSEKHLGRIKTVSKEYREKTMQVLRITFLSAFSLELISTLSIAILAVAIGLRLLYGRLTFNQAFLILLVAPEFYLPFRNLGLRYHAAKTAITGAKNIFRLLDMPDEFPILDLPLSLEPKFIRGNSLTFDNVFTGYEPDKLILKEIHIDLKIGSRIALVGPSGSGKSTFFQLILRFLKPTSGYIYLDGHNINNYPIEQWRSKISWVPQNPMIFEGSLLENIRIAKPDATQNEINKAIFNAGLDQFILQTEEGDKRHLQEYGTSISHGEKQRIALARAFLKAGELTLFDEPTAALDPELESFIQESIRTLAEKSTVITIAHRINTIRSSDQILLFNQGQIIGNGNHEELLKTNQFYQRFCKAYFREIV